MVRRDGSNEVIYRHDDKLSLKNCHIAQLGERLLTYRAAFDKTSGLAQVKATLYLFNIDGTLVSKRELAPLEKFVMDYAVALSNTNFVVVLTGGIDREDL